MPKLPLEQLIHRPKVYIPNEPMRMDYQQDRMIPIYDIKPISEFGDIVFIFPGRAPPPLSPEAVLPKLRRTLNAFTPNDYIAVIGEVTIVIWASIIASRNIGGMMPLKLLKWNKRTYKYMLYEASVG
jgi:hypothetical protein